LQHLEAVVDYAVVIDSDVRRSRHPRDGETAGAGAWRFAAKVVPRGGRAATAVRRSVFVVAGHTNTPSTIAFTPAYAGGDRHGVQLHRPDGRIGAPV
jgi:hypothetical protein